MGAIDFARESVKITLRKTPAPRERKGGYKADKRRIPVDSKKAVREGQ